VLFGQSVGCAVAVEMSSRGFGSGMVLLSPFASIADMAETMFPKWLIRPWTAAGFVSDPFDSIGKALLGGGGGGGGGVPPAVARRTCVVHGDQDEIVPYSQGRSLAAALQGSKFHTLKKAGHNDVWGRRFAELLFHKVKRCIETATTRSPGPGPSSKGKRSDRGSTKQGRRRGEQPPSAKGGPVPRKGRQLEEAAPPATEEDMMDFDGLSVDDDDDDDTL
jgi:fermentation-respiration switch protein FrsA (DUF1100 family)